MAKRQQHNKPTRMPNERPLREVEPIAPVGARTSEPKVEPQADDSATPDAPVEPAMDPTVEAAAEPASDAGPKDEPISTPIVSVAAESAAPISSREMLRLMDEGWSWFRAAAGSFPNEHMDEHLGDGWTRKQMLAHIAAWHDRTHDRLGSLIAADKPADSIEDADRFNARIARQAIGRTAGEVLKDMEGTFNRLRRRVAQLTSDQLAAHDNWAVQVIAGNTYDHYEEHREDVRHSVPVDPRQSRR